MNCLLISATAKEIMPFLDHYQNAHNNRDIDVLITGIGLTATAYSLTKQLHLKKPQFVIQAGIAGCYNKNILPGSVVVVKQEAVADMSVMEKGHLKTMFDVGLAKPAQKPFKNSWLINKHKQLLKKTGLKEVAAVSVNHITTSKKMIMHYQNKFRPVIESMEGAALHYVCLMEKIPFLQIRSISNYVGERNKKKWSMKEAILNLNNELISIISKL